MKKVPKLLKIPHNLAEALRTVAFKRRVHQGDYILEALAECLEADPESSGDVLANLAEYRAETAHQVEEDEAERG